MDANSGGLAGTLKRYGVLLIIGAALAVFALVPVFTGGNDNDDSTESASTASQPASGSSTTVGSAPDTATPDTTASDDSAPDTATPDTTASDDSAPDIATTTVVPEDTTSELSLAAGGRLNSPAALAAPDCDADRQRLMVVSAWAPPCAEPWPAGTDNGGATSRGVTADTIKVVIAYFQGQGDDVESAWKNQSAAYDHTYRLWGRTVEPVFFEMGPNDEATQRADAIRIADMEPFAVWLQVGGQTNAIRLQELVSRDILVVTANAPVELTNLNPGYLWGTALPPYEVNLLHITEYVGKRLVGRPAIWAGDADSQTKERVFGLVYPDEWELSDFESEFSKYGGVLADSIDYEITYDQAKYQERARIIISRLKDAGVTSVIAASDGLLNISLSLEATSQNWFPEWIVASVGGSNVDFLARSNDPEQWKHAFGISMLPTPLQSDIRQDMFSWYWGRDAPDKNRGSTTSGVVWGVFGLYTGLHMAGPELTPETFAQGMFAFPPAGGLSCNCVLSQQVSWGDHGFFPYDDYNGWDDFVEIWWDADYVGRSNDGNVDETPGHYRSTEGGRRHLYGSWPETDPMVFDDATSPDITEPSESDTLPNYECVGCPGR